MPFANLVHVVLIYIVVNLRTKRPSSGIDEAFSSGQQLVKKYHRFVAAIDIVCDCVQLPTRFMPEGE